MSIERTLSIIKPDAMHAIGAIYQRLMQENLKIVAAKMRWLTLEQAKQLYHLHQGKSFFTPLVQFITSQPVMLQVLEGEDAIARYRNLMGSTDPQKAGSGTLRAEFGKAAQNLWENVAHGSDSPENAQYEIDLFFDKSEIYKR